MKNKQALINVAEWLENGAKHVEIPSGHNIGNFDMEQSVSFEGGCGTACCIAGAVVQFENLIDPVKSRWAGATFYDIVDDDDEVVDRGVGTIAREFLGIDENDAEKLFLPWERFDSETFYEFSDPERAAKVIRHYLETGVVDWDNFPASPEYCDPEEYE